MAKCHSQQAFPLGINNLIASFPSFTHPFLVSWHRSHALGRDVRYKIQVLKHNPMASFLTAGDDTGFAGGKASIATTSPTQ